MLFTRMTNAWPAVATHDVELHLAIVVQRCEQLADLLLRHVEVAHDEGGRAGVLRGDLRGRGEDVRLEAEPLLDGPSGDLHVARPRPRMIDDHSALAGRRSTCCGGEPRLQEVAGAPPRRGGTHGMRDDVLVEGDRVLAPGARRTKQRGKMVADLIHKPVDPRTTQYQAATNPRPVHDRPMAEPWPTHDDPRATQYP